MIVIKARGHPNIKATHRTTIEVTKDNYLTGRGDCILGIDADKSLKDMKEFLDQNKKREIKVDLVVENLVESIKGYLDPRLTFLDEKDIVIRKSSYICDRTLMIHASKSAAEINRKIIRKLRERKEMTLRISVI
ncbi:MAG: DUF371 domain-containing protein [Methanomicrobia archaeon]|nr:DUF371 domain-containing protein [Methanomicrobia archaeon]RLF94503.1 MAG: DUF371 domain-containing protein [Thermococci archaeon]